MIAEILLCALEKLTFSGHVSCHILFALRLETIQDKSPFKVPMKMEKKNIWNTWVIDFDGGLLITKKSEKNLFRTEKVILIAKNRVDIWTRHALLGLLITCEDAIWHHLNLTGLTGIDSYCRHLIIF